MSSAQASPRQSQSCGPHWPFGTPAHSGFRVERAGRVAESKRLSVPSRRRMAHEALCFQQFRGFDHRAAAAERRQKSPFRRKKVCQYWPIARCLLGGRRDRAKRALGFGRPRGLPAAQRQGALEDCRA